MNKKKIQLYILKANRNHSMAGTAPSMTPTVFAADTSTHPTNHRVDPSHIATTRWRRISSGFFRTNTPPTRLLSTATKPKRRNDGWRCNGAWHPLVAFPPLSSARCDNRHLCLYHAKSHQRKCFESPSSGNRETEYVVLYLDQ